MRARYPSDSYSADKSRRLKRIERCACRELQQAYQSGRLSLRQYDLLSRRPAKQQKHLIAARKARVSAAIAAAATINQFLDSRGTGAPLSLREVVTAISRGQTERP
jgi:hypothetical protein